jgi:hypothetical protein
MALQLNEPGENTYTEFRGKTIDKMPELDAQGLIPASVAHIMQRRLDALEFTESVKNNWWMYDFDTGDTIVTNRSGGIKIVLDSQEAWKINTESILQNNALVIPYGHDIQYVVMQLSEREVAKYATGKPQTFTQALGNPILRALARDERLHEEHTRALFKKAKSDFGYNVAMPINISRDDGAQSLRLWTIGRVKGFDYDDPISSLDGSNGLNYHGRIVGMTPSLEQVMKTSSKQAIRKMESSCMEPSSSYR